MRKSRAWIAALAIAAASCAHGGSSKQATKVSDMDLARVSPGELDAVNRKRMDVAKAQDATNRADLNRKETEQELKVAKSDVGVAKAEMERANNAIALAGQTHQQEALANAQQDKVNAQNHLDLANAHVNAIQAQLDEAKAQRDVAQRQLELQQQQYEQEKYQALVRVNDPAVQNYSGEDIQNNVASAERRLNDAKASLDRRSQQSEAAMQKFRDQQQRLQAQGPGQPPRG